MSDWISIKDMLPPLGRYLAFNGGTVWCSAYYPPDQYPDRVDAGDGWLDMNHVTHWQPLPEPPK